MSPVCAKSKQVFVACLILFFFLFCRVKVYKGRRELADSGYIHDNSFAGGRMGLYVFSQAEVIWTDLSYRANGMSLLKERSSELITISTKNNPYYWTSRKNSLELIVLAVLHKCSWFSSGFLLSQQWITHCSCKKIIVNALPKVVGFRWVFWIPPTDKLTGWM